MQSDLEQRAGRVQALEQENARLRAQADAGPAAEAA
jgi:cell shape-determining protein MreC